MFFSEFFSSAASLSSASASEVSAYSLASLRTPLSGPAELLVCAVSGGEARFLGQFERNLSPSEGAIVVRRISGGGTWLLGEGRVYYNLRLRTPSALVPCNEEQLLNRYVRPLLRGLGRAGAVSQYFGRDWVSSRGAPIAGIAFAHEQRTGRTVIEGVVAVSSPFSDDRPTFLGKTPGTLPKKAGETDRDVERKVCEHVVRAYHEAYGASCALIRVKPTDQASQVSAEVGAVPWDAVVHEAIGPIGASTNGASEPGISIGGEFMASFDAVRAFEARIAAHEGEPTEAELRADIAATLTSTGAALFGVRDVGSIARVVLSAIRARTLRGGTS